MLHRCNITSSQVSVETGSKSIFVFSSLMGKLQESIDYRTSLSSLGNDKKHRRPRGSSILQYALAEPFDTYFRCHYSASFCHICIQLRSGAESTRFGIGPGTPNTGTEYTLWNECLHSSRRDHESYIIMILALLHSTRSVTTCKHKNCGAVQRTGGVSTVQTTSTHLSMHWHSSSGLAVTAALEMKRHRRSHQYHANWGGYDTGLPVTTPSRIGENVY